MQNDIKKLQNKNQERTKDRGSAQMDEQRKTGMQSETKKAGKNTRAR